VRYCGDAAETLSDARTSAGFVNTARGRTVPQADISVAVDHLRGAVYPQAFSTAHPTGAAAEYLADAPALKLAEFFEAKGLPALKEEDRREQWYDDWLAYQREHRLYATLLAPQQFSSLGGRFDLLRLARFLELFGYFSPAHGYSLQVTFLGLFAMLMGTNEGIKRDAVAAVEAGELIGFAVSERNHGADLLGNEFSIGETSPGRLVANGSKYYVGNCNRAAIIATLARRERGRARDGANRRSPIMLVALRAAQATEVRTVAKIHTLGVRAAFVGSLDVRGHQLSADDVIAEGRGAWEAFFGAVTLGKFFLGFGSIGICEHAFQEAADHLGNRSLYGRPALDMPHIRQLMAEAYVRLTAMKLYAYRALDYLQAASADDRRYLLFNAVQKAKVSTEGVKVMSLLSECIGAKGFEADTFFEMALRDVQLIPSLEGSTHINLALAAQFIPRYFDRRAAAPPAPASLLGGQAVRDENPYLMQARHGAVGTVGFDHFLSSYEPLLSIDTVRSFVKQAKRFQLFTRDAPASAVAADTAVAMGTGRVMATIAYGQLIAENCARVSVPAQIVSLIFHLLGLDIGAVTSAAFDGAFTPAYKHAPAPPPTDFTFVWERVAAAARDRARPTA
jgi:acyl-CoA dehydrogenase